MQSDSYTMKNYPASTANSVAILVLLWPVVIVSRQSLEKDMVIRDSNPSSLRIWVIMPLGKSLKPEEVIAESKKNCK